LSWFILPPSIARSLLMAFEHEKIPRTMSATHDVSDTRLRPHADVPTTHASALLNSYLRVSSWWQLHLFLHGATRTLVTTPHASVFSHSCNVYCRGGTPLRNRGVVRTLGAGSGPLRGYGRGPYPPKHEVRSRIATPQTK